MTNARNIKAWFCLVCMATSMAAPVYGPGRLQLDIIDMAAISRMTPQQLEALAEGLAAEEIMRTKRSSAQELATSVVSKASSGLQSKVGLLGQASAGITSFVASASSKTGHSEHGYSYEPHNENVDYWGLKKSIFHTLFQAVKAITGGVTILKGQLIKGGGALAATLGKVISSKGDAVSNFGKKIVSSAALSHKKPSHPVYGPPAEYASPSGYGGTAPAHFSHTAPAHTAPTGFAAHKYPSHIDGRGKLSGVHAGLVILTPLAEAGNIEHHESSGHTALEPPPSLLHTVYSAIKDAFSSAATHTEETVLTDQVPPPPQPMPPFKPMAWGAVNSYGEPADSYTDYDPRNPYPPYSYASSKLSSAPSQPKHQGLTQEKIQKINANLEKVNAYLNENQRSSEEVPSFNTQYTDMLRKGLIPFLPTPVVSDNEIGVLPGELLPDPLTTTSTSTTTVSTPKNTTDKENKRQKKDIKYLLRGNRILQV
ncbi:uncharacterized protein LOC116766940 [Danaus plexippus]|uniref:uncharacterized protein LOC116766940 n=1 Tax=Danaus plexippus TaxID=13037 RepID=UPI002AB1B71E|nr:uncharacterized protein LOC116766940 [Danaus plexippus]